MTGRAVPSSIDHTSHAYSAAFAAHNSLPPLPPHDPIAMQQKAVGYLAWLNAANTRTRFVDAHARSQTQTQAQTQTHPSVNFTTPGRTLLARSVSESSALTLQTTPQPLSAIIINTAQQQQPPAQPTPSSSPYSVAGDKKEIKTDIDFILCLGLHECFLFCIIVFVR